ncbi:MAG: ABC transporter substrate-binding protein, partial [Bacteroidia bacterium]
MKIGLKQLASFNVPVIVLISFLFYQCGSTTNADDGFFYYNEQNEITSLDPLMANGQEHIWPVSQLFNGLLKLDSNLAIKPDLAKSYSVSADGRRYTFVLRNNVYFNDDECFKNGKGRRLVAQDVEYSFNRLL